MSSKTKWFFQWGVFPAIAGLLAGHLFNEHNNQAGAAVTPRPPALAFPISTATDSDTTHSKKSPPFPPAPLKPESVAERIRNLADNRRVEDLREELEHLPPGADRDLAIGLLAEHWFAFDHAGTIAWIAKLKLEKEKELAYVPLIKAWTREDSEGASTWVAELPKGSLKKIAGRTPDRT